jgi:hypothetical protein
LLALPPETLREASEQLQQHQRIPASTPHGERRERFYALALVCVLLSAPLGAVLFH